MPGKKLLTLLKYARQATTVVNPAAMAMNTTLLLVWKPKMARSMGMTTIGA